MEKAPLDINLFSLAFFASLRENLVFKGLVGVDILDLFLLQMLRLCGFSFDFDRSNGMVPGTRSLQGFSHSYKGLEFQSIWKTIHLPLMV